MLVYGNHWGNEGYLYQVRFLILYMRAWKPVVRAFATEAWDDNVWAIKWEVSGWIGTEEVIQENRS